MRVIGPTNVKLFYQYKYFPYMELDSSYNFMIYAPKPLANTDNWQGDDVDKKDLTRIVVKE